MTDDPHPEAAHARPRIVGRGVSEYTVWRPESAHPRDRDRARALGAAVRRHRQAARLTQRDLAREAAVSERHLQRLERGDRLTRRSTLERLARALAKDEDATELLLETLLETAGPTLAAETDHPGRVERRRHRRHSRVDWNQHDLVSVARVSLIGGDVLERRVTDEPDAVQGRRRSVSFVVLPADGGSDELEIEPTPELLAAFRKFPIRWSRPHG